MGSSSEMALRLALSEAEKIGANTRIFSGACLDLPAYDPQKLDRCDKAKRLVSALRMADGIIIASPGYHGSISGMLKNALDYTEDMRGDPQPYFEGRAVGCIVSAAGWQAVGSTLAAMRSIVHALRGWPTPLGVGFNSMETRFSQQGVCSDPSIASCLETLAVQVMGFAEKGVEQNEPALIPVGNHAA